MRIAAQHPYLTIGLGLFGGVAGYYALSRAHLFSQLGRAAMCTALPTAALIMMVRGRLSPIERVAQDYQIALSQVDANLTCYGSLAYVTAKEVTLLCPGNDACGLTACLAADRLAGEEGTDYLSSKLQGFKERITQEHAMMSALELLTAKGAAIIQRPEKDTRFTTVVQTGAGTRIILSFGELLRIKTESDAATLLSS